MPKKLKKSKRPKEEAIEDQEESFQSETSVQIPDQSDVSFEDLEPKEIKPKKNKKSKQSTRSKELQDEPFQSKTLFKDFDLDERILKAIAELGWERPTQVQEAMIPLALENKNIMARARTGSGKTAAFLLPVLQKILQVAQASDKESGPFAIFVAPTKELATQIYKLLNKLIAPLPFLQSINLADLDQANEEILTRDVVFVDMVVTTPGRLVTALDKKTELLKSVRHLVLDEADLLLSYGYEGEMKKIRNALPTKYQVIFTSATLVEDMSTIKEMFVTGPVVSLKLKEGQLPNPDQLTQYHILCQNEEERFTILLSLIKLKLLVGKSIIFVSNTDRCYKLSLFLQAFKIRSCILNSQMPANYRYHIVQEFNEGKYPYIIASDTNDLIPEGEDEEDGAPKSKKAKKQKPQKKNKHLDKESGVSRGIDFHYVSNVINFDFPPNTDVYVHRVGRTARGWNKGTAISFITEKEKDTFKEVQEEINAQMGQQVMMPYEIRMKDFESFLLRTREALAACTKIVIREARLAEIKEEILRSKRLQAYFAKNPREKAALEQDKKLFKLNLHSPAIADVADYMVPEQLKGQDFGIKNEKKLQLQNRKRKHHWKTANQRKHQRKEQDPLRSFKF